MARRVSRMAGSPMPTRKLAKVAHTVTYRREVWCGNYPFHGYSLAQELHHLWLQTSHSTQHPLSSQLFTRIAHRCWGLTSSHPSFIDAIPSLLSLTITCLHFSSTSTSFTIPSYSISVITTTPLQVRNFSVLSILLACYNLDFG